MKSSAKGIGLAIVGGGRVGLFRGEVAARHPAVEWIGLAEKNPNRAGDVASRIDADFVTGDHRELLKRPEVTAAIICTDEHLHVEPIIAGVEAGVPMLIEKPLATDLAQSARVLKAIQDAGLDAAVGYTQRFRRRWLAAKEKCRTGALGELRGPMADETVSWLSRVSLGLPTPAATVAEAHRNLMLTKALDLSAKRKQPVQLPLDPS